MASVIFGSNSLFPTQGIPTTGKVNKFVSPGRPGLTNLLTFPVVGMPWVGKSELDPKMTDAIRKTLRNLKNRRVLKPLEDDLVGFHETTDRDYNGIREG